MGFKTNFDGKKDYSEPFLAMIAGRDRYDLMIRSRLEVKPLSYEATTSARLGCYNPVTSLQDAVNVVEMCEAWS